jgi:hypothetical protein
MTNADQTGKLFEFDAQGDGPAYYRIAQYNSSARAGSNPYVTVGKWSTKGGLYMQNETMFWNIGEALTPLCIRVRR